MSEDPATRRARLDALRAAAAAEAGGPAEAAPAAAAGAAQPVLKFRNYAADAAALGAVADAVEVLPAARAPDLVTDAPVRTVVPEGAADEVRRR